MGRRGEYYFISHLQKNAAAKGRQQQTYQWLFISLKTHELQSFRKTRFI